MSDVVSLEVIRAQRRAAIAAVEAKREVSPDELNDAFDRVLAAFVCALERELSPSIPRQPTAPAQPRSHPPVPAQPAPTR